MPIKIKSFAFLSFITLLLFCGLIINQLQKQLYPVLPDSLNFQRIDGVKQSLSQLKGKPLVVTFWSPECVLCLAEVEHFNQLYQELQGGKQFEILALSMYYDRPDRVILSSSQAGMIYPVYFDLERVLSKAFGRIVATPTSFLLDKNGSIVYRHAGVLDFTLLKQKLLQLTG